MLLVHLYPSHTTLTKFFVGELRDKTPYLAQDKSPHRGLGCLRSIIRLAGVAVVSVIICLAANVFEDILVLEVVEVLNVCSIEDLVTGVE
jgi:hypothetical protein